MRAAKLAPLVTIPALAKTLRRPRRTLFRHLLALHAKDRDAGGGHWLTRPGTRGWRVNLSALRKAHPGLFEQYYVEREEFEELRNRVDAIDEKQKTEKERLSATIARVRRVEAA